MASIGIDIVLFVKHESLLWEKTIWKIPGKIIPPVNMTRNNKMEKQNITES
jgi:hypothetical protein